MLKKVLIVWLLWMSFCTVLAQDKKNQWIDSVFQTLNTKEKIGQLFIIPISTSENPGDIEVLKAKVKNNQVGGILITGGGPVATAGLVNQVQEISTTPLLVMLDASRGPGSTLDSLMTFPNPLSIGAIKDDSLVYKLGSEIARQMKLLGVNMNLAPNADIDIDPSNPFHYLGSDKYAVANKAIALMQGLQDNGVIACAKHPHYTSASDNKSKESYQIDFVNNRLDTLEFYPYQKLMEAGIGGMLTSNLHFSMQDKRKQIPASVSQLFISDILKKQMNYAGLTITEIPYFHELSGKSKGESEKLAFDVGNDLLINPFNVNTSIKKIEASLKKNVGLRLQLDLSVKRILSAKYDAGLWQKSKVNTDNIIQKINSAEAFLLKHKLVEASITLVSNEIGLVPIKILDGKRFASLTIGTSADSTFSYRLSQFSAFDFFKINNVSDTSGIKNKLIDYDVIIVDIHNNVSNFPLIINWLNSITSSQQVIVCAFTSPYDLMGLGKPQTLIIGYTDDSLMQDHAVQTIFGTMQAQGRTPISVDNLFRAGEGIPNNKLMRLGFGIPEQVGMNSNTLKNIDAIVTQAIDSGATPGCNIIIARKGKVIFDKAYGWKTYDKVEPTSHQTIYDLASITKVAATLQTVMFMHEKKLIDVNKKVSTYLPELKNSNKKDFTIKDILTHQAGLWPYLPFWLGTMKDSTLLPEYYSSSQSQAYPYPVAKDLFASKTMKDSLWHWIIEAKIREKKPKQPYDYTYSDMGFYILQHLAEQLLNQPIQDFVSQNFYEPLGAYTTGFLPLERFPESQIAPTEVDKSFRGSKLIGYVHDQGAAMHGGVAGHAGLFSSAIDLAKLGQMWLQKGTYGDHQFFKPETLDLFTTQQYETNRRGLGWDKPTQSDWNGPTSLYASPKTFGHTGFTGTAIWVDPEFDLVFVFLSNRVYPDMFNGKLLSGNIRPRIQDVIYQSIFDYCKAGK